MAAIAEGLSPRSTVHDWFVRWHCRGALDRLHFALYQQARELAGKEASPTTAIVDSQRQERRKRGPRIDASGYDAGKKVKGKKRHAIVDTLGLTLGVSVTPANVQDRDGFLPLLKEARRVFAFLERLIADGAYSGEEMRAAAKRAGKVDLKIVKRSNSAKGFVVLPLRWIVERTLGWFDRCRRIAKDFENLTRTQLAFVKLAMIRLMARRIARLSKSS